VLRVCAACFHGRVALGFVLGFCPLVIPFKSSCISFGYSFQV
jgi:hypothetical protein